MDVTGANIEVSRQDFLQHLTDSKLVDESEIAALAASDADVLSIANSLVTSGALTDFQLDALSQGRPEELRVGNYDILSRLGAGGMGTVFKARHRRMKRIVALKVLAASLSKDTAFVQRFQREVETIARLGHPNIVMAYDADEAEIGHFLVMEFVDGRDLASLVESDRALPVHTALDYIVQTARGLAYAHSQGIIHRDIKPHNLLHDQNGTVKITDLGLARLSQANISENSAITQAGGILGTADYMPPEQALDSTTIDHRADIYSLGCTLFYLLTGRPPYVGQSIMSILLMHRESPIPFLSKLRSDVPPEIDGVIQRMIAKVATDRFQSMSEVITALEAIAVPMGGRPASVVPAPTAAPTAASASSLAMNKATESIFVAGANTAQTTTVLIVEPSRVQAGIIRKYLESGGITIASAVTTGQQALDAIRASRPDAVVAAMHLDDFTGLDLARQIRASLPHEPPGFVLISSESDESGSLSQLNRVMALRKPFDAEQLVQALNLVLGRLHVQPSGSGSGSDGTGQRSNRAKYRVLIVDDSASARRHERGVMEGLGFTELVEAADGAQAIAAATRERFDLIVTDYNMPLMDGHAFVSYLKQTPALATIPVVMVTTETDERILGPVRKLGVIAVFDKRFAPDEIRAVLDRLF